MTKLIDPAPYEGPSEAEARLQNAAPDLLAALEAVRGLARSAEIDALHIQPSANGEATLSKLRQIMDQARQAIELAKGEAQ